MANRVFRELQGSLTNRIVLLTGRLVLGTSGAVATPVPAGRGFQVVHSGTGLYTVTLEDFYTSLEKFMVTVMSASSPVTTGNGYFLPVASNTIEAVPPGKTFTFQMYTTSTLANAVPNNNAELRIEISLKNSTVL